MCIYIYNYNYIPYENNNGYIPTNIYMVGYQWMLHGILITRPRDCELAELLSLNMAEIYGCSSGV